MNDCTLIPAHLRSGEITGPVWTAFVGGQQALRSIDEPRGWTPNIEHDPDTWYTGTHTTLPGLPAVVPYGSGADELFAELGVEPDAEGSAFLSESEIGSLSRWGESLFADLRRAGMQPRSSATITIADDEHGRATSIVLRLDNGPEPDTITLDIEYGIDAFDVPSIDDLVEVPRLELPGASTS